MRLPDRAAPATSVDPAAAPRAERTFAVEGLSIIVPVFNEERRLGAAVKEMLASASVLHVPVEVVVVDDGSTDDTAIVAASLSAADRRIAVMRHERRRRLGAALRTGIAGARYPRVILGPVDCPLRPEEICALYEGCSVADVVVGFREGRADHRGLVRAASRLYHFLLRAALGVRLRDYNWCCAYRRAIFEGISIRFDGMIALPEILGRAHRAGMKFFEVPVGSRPSVVGEANLRRLRVWARTAFDLALLAIDLRLRARRRAVRDASAAR
jgi:glycosyltransferase involved in cell wall biosynthesis